MPYAKPDALVSTEWLEGHLRSPGVRVVDASWFFPNTDKTGRTEFEREHIPEAVFFDIDEIAAPKVATDDGITLPHMMPDIRRFTQRVTDLGLATAIASSFTIASVAVRPRPASGSCSAASAMTMWLCSTAACRNGWRRIGL